MMKQITLQSMAHGQTGQTISRTQQHLVIHILKYVLRSFDNETNHGTVCSTWPNGTEKQAHAAELGNSCVKTLVSTYCFRSFFSEH
uniref:Uncharacterized protein n=1 Tax=Arion vulgaris TaxID=1028688 RepID=A0A0B7AIV4_9EUPU